MISARAKGVSTVPVPLMVPGVQDPDGPDRLDHLLGGARLPRRACPARGRAAGRTRSTRPVRPELPRSGRRGRAECGSRCPAGRSAGIVRPRDQGRTPPRASIGLLVQSSSDIFSEITLYQHILMRSGEYAEWGLVTLTCQHRGRRPSARQDRWPAGTVRPGRSDQRAGFAVLYLPPDLLSIRRRTRPGLTNLLT